MPERVLIPVPVECPAPQVPARPSLPLEDLTGDSEPSTIARAYAETVEILMGYAEQLEILLGAYTDKGDKPAPDKAGAKSPVNPAQ